MIISLQSLLITGMQVDVKGNIEFQQRLMEHLYQPNTSTSKSSTYLQFYLENVTSQRLKHDIDTTEGIQILSQMMK